MAKRLLAHEILIAHFGDSVAVCQAVGVELLARGPLSITEIARACPGVGLAGVKQALLVLMQHNCIEDMLEDIPNYKTNDVVNVQTQYRAILSSIIARQHYPLFLAHAIDALGAQKGAVLEALLRHGRLSAKMMKQHARHNPDRFFKGIQNHDGSNSSEVAAAIAEKSLRDLIEERVVERSPPSAAQSIRTADMAAKAAADTLKSDSSVSEDTQRHAKAAATRVAQLQAAKMAENVVIGRASPPPPLRKGKNGVAVPNGPRGTSIHAPPRQTTRILRFAPPLSRKDVDNVSNQKSNKRIGAERLIRKEKIPKVDPSSPLTASLQKVKDVSTKTALAPSPAHQTNCQHFAPQPPKRKESRFRPKAPPSRAKKQQTDDEVSAAEVAAESQMNRVLNQREKGEDELVLFRCNCEELLRRLRHVFICQFLGRVHGQEAAQLIQAMLVAGRDRETTLRCARTPPVTPENVYTQLRKISGQTNIFEANIKENIDQVDEMLNSLANGTFNSKFAIQSPTMEESPEEEKEKNRQPPMKQRYVHKEPSGTYVVEAGKVMDTIRVQELLAMIKARFGAIAFRIFSLLRTRPCLEQKIVASLAVIDLKAAREALYRLHSASYVIVHEAAKSAETVAAKTFYLWTAEDDTNATRLFADETCKAAFNMRRRLRYELDKEEQIMRLVEQYQQSAGGERPQLKEEHLEKVRRIQRLADTLESSLLNLDVLILKLAYL